MEPVNLTNQEIQVTIHAINACGGSTTGELYKKTIKEVVGKLNKAISSELKTREFGKGI